MRHDESEYFRGPIIPVDQVLGRRTLAAIRAARGATAAILKRPTDPGQKKLADFSRLTEWRTLSASQFHELVEILSDARSYWTGCPVFRRFPPRPGFAIRMTGGRGDDVVLLIDLQNPGWEIHCGAERYWGFHFAGPRVGRLAKSVFPEFASDSARSIWKRGAIDSLGPLD
jgi:hypothetical protein